MTGKFEIIVNNKKMAVLSQIGDAFGEQDLDRQNSQPA